MHVVSLINSVYLIGCDHSNRTLSKTSQVYLCRLFPCFMVSTGQNRL